MKKTILLFAICLIFGNSITAFADTGKFYFRIEPGKTQNSSDVKKADDEQRAYVTSTVSIGEEYLSVFVIDSVGEQVTSDLNFYSGELATKVSPYLEGSRGIAGEYYRLHGWDRDHAITTSQYILEGKWTP